MQIFVNYHHYKIVMASAEKTYMVLSLDDYSVSYLDEVPKGGWTDDHKSLKMVFRYIPAGSFVMGSPDSELGRKPNETQHEVTLTRPFYMSIFTVTEMQFYLIAGNKFSVRRFGSKRPIDIPYFVIRDSNDWPQSDKIGKNSFLYELRQKSNLNFDLPTEAQWEYACRAGTATAFNNGANITDAEVCLNLDKLGKYWRYGRYDLHVDDVEDDKPAIVGSYFPNAWGLYDMHGNIDEWCLDWFSEEQDAEPVTDPKGSETGDYRVLRGGGFGSMACWCRSAVKCRDIHGWGTTHGFNCGFRLVLGL